MAANVVELLALAGRAAASADNSQPWCMVWDGACLSVQFRRPQGASLSPPPASVATLLAMGGVIENIVQMGSRLGLDLQPQTGIGPPPETPTYARIPLEAGAGVQALPGDHPLFSRHTNRFPFQKKALPAGLLSELQAMSEGSASIQLVDDAAGIRHIASLVKSASQVRFRVREAHEWLAGSLRFAAADGDGDSGMAIDSLDLPPGGAWLLRITRSWRVMSALNKLGVYKFMAAADTAPVYAAPALLVIKGSNHGAGTIDAGRLLTRAWIRLNEHNIAVHPYYAIADQLERLRDNTLPSKLRTQVIQIREACTSACALEDGESLYMVLRVGYPQKAAPKSKRVALATVFRDLTASAAQPQ